MYAVGYFSEVGIGTEPDVTEYALRLAKVSCLTDFLRHDSVRSNGTNEQPIRGTSVLLNVCGARRVP